MITYGIMGGISKSIGLLLLPVLTHQFSAGEYGIIEIISTFSSLLGMFMTLSLNSAISRFWFESVEKKIESELISTILFFVTITGTLVLLFIWFTSDFFSKILLEESVYSTFIFLGGLAAFLSAMATFPQIVLRMQRKIVLYNTLSIIQTVIYVITALVLLFILEMGLVSVFIGMVVGYLVSFLFGLYTIKSNLMFTFSSIFLTESLKYSIPILPSLMVTWVNKQIDKVLLLFFLGLSVVGVFGAASKLALIVVLLTNIFRQAWSPFAMSMINDDPLKRNEFYRRILNYYTVIMLTIGLFIVTFAAELLMILVPPEYYYGYVILPWIIGAKIFHAAGNITNLGMLVSKKTFGNSIAAWIGASVNIVLSLILIPKFGIFGVAIGTFFAELIFASTLMYFSFKTAEVRFDIRNVSFMVLIYCITSILLLIIFELNLVFEQSLLIRSLILIIGATILLSIGLNRVDINLIKNFTLKKIGKGLF